MVKGYLMEAEENPEIEELSDLFSCSHVNISSLYDRFGLWDTYHILDLVCNNDYPLKDILEHMKKHSLRTLVREAKRKQHDEGDDITEIFLRDALRFFPTRRATVAANILYGDLAEDSLYSDHLPEHLASRMDRY